jgi:hypothetical protein
MPRPVEPAGARRTAAYFILAKWKRGTLSAMIGMSSLSLIAQFSTW